ncbi:hypothetical protein Vqi01_38870 [Micromonospora qiuiae]|uniref:Uncharacterized protein n=1 Tax=Micromonospora qiuiae TaxID=502268 RepID=A0ABQ4JGZ2_9ACTN|nr:hypothetical protein Vqi01_38870 [Micromonospora qiuiae]
MLVGQVQHGEDAGLVEADAVLQHLGPGLIEDLWHGRTLQGRRAARNGLLAVAQLSDEQHRSQVEVVSEWIRRGPRGGW